MTARPRLLICTRGDMGPADTVVFGSVRGACAFCEQAVWLAPTSQRELARVPSITVCCLDCLPRVDPEVEVPVPTPAQMGELHAHYGRN